MLKHEELLGKLINEDEWQKISEVEKQFQGYEHPIFYLLKDDMEIYHSSNFNKLTFLCTKRAFSILNDSQNQTFQKKIKKQLIGKDLQNINGALGEVRCFGYLFSVFGLNVKPIKESETPTPDFEVKCENDSILIEVNTLQVNKKEVDKFDIFKEKYDSNGVYERVTVFQKPNKSYIRSVYEKLTNAKKDSKQLTDINNPTILWIDLHDSYISKIAYRIDKSGPYFSTADGNIMFNELWYSVYATENMAMFNCSNLHCGEGIKTNLPKTKFGGRFDDLENNFISAIVYYGPNGLVIFENPNASYKLPDSFIKYFSKGENFKIENSRINFPTNNLKERIEIEKESVNELAKNNFYKF